MAGMLLGALVVEAVGPPNAGSTLRAVGLAGTGTLAVFWLVFKNMGASSSMQSVKTIEAAIQAGRLGVARVDTLRQTGTQINDQPLCDVEMTVQPDNGIAYRTSLRMILPLVEIPRFQPGTPHRVAILAQGQPDVAFIVPPASDPLWASRNVPPKEQAGELLAPPIGMLRPDGTRSRSFIGAGKKGRPVRIAVYALVFLLAAGAVLYPYQKAVAQTITALQHGKMHADLREPEPVNEAIQALTEQIGHGYVFNVGVYSDRVSVQAPVAVEKLESDDWNYQRGVVEREGAALIQPTDAREQFATSEVNWSALWPAAQKASTMADINDLDDVSFQVLRETTTSTDTEAGPVEVVFWLKNDYHSAWFRMNADGTGLTMTSKK
jgi:hypothetical protein